MQTLVYRTPLLKTNATHQISLGYGQEQLDICIQGIVESVIAVEPKDAKIDVRPGQGGLQHGEAYADALQLEGVVLLFRYVHGQNSAA